MFYNYTVPISTMSCKGCVIFASVILVLVFISNERAECYPGERSPAKSASPINNRDVDATQYKPTMIGGSDWMQGVSQIKVNDIDKLDQGVKTPAEQSEKNYKTIPDMESNGNSQVVFVNLTRVVNDGSRNNETVKLVRQPEIIKQADQISCGETNPKGQPSMVVPSTDPIANRIVGGNKAEPGEFPYQVRLNIKSRRGSSLCGGSIIDQRHILTAAHCVTTCSSYFVATSKIEASAIKATVGDFRITASDGEQIIDIESVTAHESYSACSYSHNNYDIAILKTSKPMTWIFTKDGFGSVNRVCLPHPNDNYAVGENMTVSGWGVMLEGDNSISNTLMAVDVPIVSYEECKVAYGQRLNKNHICAGLKEGGRDSCQGDSGGPLVRRLGGQVEITGVVSFGFGCAQPGMPGVYTKVSDYIDWILNNL